MSGSNGGGGVCVIFTEDDISSNVTKVHIPHKPVECNNTLITLKQCITCYEQRNVWNVVKFQRSRGIKLV